VLLALANALDGMSRDGVARSSRRVWLLDEARLAPGLLVEDRGRV
jgi:hypothetical protein